MSFGVWSLKKNFTKLIIIIVVTCLASNAKPLLIMSLEDAVSIAIQNNPQINLAKTELEINDAEIRIAQARLNPNLVSDSGIAEKTYRVGIEKTFELGDKRNKRIELAKITKQETQTRINGLQLEIESATRKAYTKLFVLQEKNRLYNELKTNNQNLLTIAQKREQSGDIASIDTMQIEMVNLKTNNNLLSLNTELQTALHEFNSLLNQDLNTQIDLLNPNTKTTLGTALGVDLNDTEKLKQPEIINQLINIALEKRTELQGNQVKSQLASKGLELAYSQRIPNLSITAGPDLVLNDGKSDDLGFFVIGNLPLPIFNRNQGEIQSAKALQKQTQQEKELLTKKIILDINNKIVEYTNLSEQVNKVETEIILKSKTINEKSLRCFEEGKCSALTVATNQEAFIKAQLDYCDLILAYQNALIDLGKALGVSL
jgi:cobalt-zinc-cadmium efflux system outer membrane protein